jgi:hypothetical protein
MKTRPPISGYVRCGVTFLEADWQFELMSDQEKVAIASITVEDGSVDVGLNRTAATRLLQKLELFLQDWPEDQRSS